MHTIKTCKPAVIFLIARGDHDKRPLISPGQHIPTRRLTATNGATLTTHNDTAATRGKPRRGHVPKNWGEALMS